MKSPLDQSIKSDAEAAAYWPMFTARERQIITNPEQHYTGLAAQKARQIARHWKKVLNPKSMSV